MGPYVNPEKTVPRERPSVFWGNSCEVTAALLLIAEFKCRCLVLCRRAEERAGVSVSRVISTCCDAQWDILWMLTCSSYESSFLASLSPLGQKPKVSSGIGASLDSHGCEGQPAM